MVGTGGGWTQSSRRLDRTEGTGRAAHGHCGWSTITHEFLTMPQSKTLPHIILGLLIFLAQQMIPQIIKMVHEIGWAIGPCRLMLDQHRRTACTSMKLFYTPPTND